MCGCRHLRHNGCGPNKGAALDGAKEESIIGVGWLDGLGAVRCDRFALSSRQYQ